CGHWGRFILRDLVDLGATVHVIARERSTHQLALAAGAASVSSDLDTIAQLADGFVVATPTPSHASIIDRLLPTGRPIFVEKPMVDDVEAARRIVATAHDRVFVMDKWRYHAGIEALADCARSGVLGTIEAIRSFRLGAIAPHTASDIF